MGKTAPQPRHYTSNKLPKTPEPHMERIQNDNAVGRRAGLALSLVAASGALLTKAAAATELSGKGMVKITALYGTPKDPEAFEKYYAETHMPMVYHAEGPVRIELGKPMPGPDGKAPPFYRITEIWFQSADALHTALGSPEWKKISADVPNFASGGATVLVSPLE
jgi:uncharacterized protein (TIGR02118 family)